MADQSPGQSTANYLWTSTAGIALLLSLLWLTGCLGDYALRAVLPRAPRFTFSALFDVHFFRIIAGEIISSLAIVVWFYVDEYWKRVISRIRKKGPISS